MDPDPRDGGSHMIAERRSLSGWGGNPGSFADVVRPARPSEVAEVIEEARLKGRSVLARGLGRSYGDAGMSAAGIVIDLTACDRILSFDPESRLLRAEAGISYDALLRWSVPQGFFVPVTPGTRHVTLGGAIAADVHGKNHHRDGSLGAAVRSLVLATAAGEVVVSPEIDSELFWATIGGMGLTGVVLEATIELMPIETALVSVDTVRTRDLDESMTLMAEGDHAYRYSVAWVDCLRAGRHLGRGVLTRANHATIDQARTLRTPGRFDGSDLLHFAPRQIVDVPFPSPVRLTLNPAVALFNEAWYRRAPRRRTDELQQISTYFHPLDGIGSWNRLYGRRGFTQYQFVVPFGAEDLVRSVIETLSGSGFPSMLAVLKRFGEGDPAPLSFPCPGWTLALDLPLGDSRLAGAMDKFDEMVAGAGGRVYFAKDGRLRPDLVASMYPRLEEWRSVRRRADPDCLFVSDLSRRLHLFGGPGR
ncbi:MAG: FAD-binding protein [Acidimicrobiales bacterium]